MISSNYQQVNFYSYYIIIFITLMPWTCYEVGYFPNTWKVLGSKQSKLTGFFSNFIPGHKAGPIIQKAARACKHGCKLLWFLFWEEVAGTGTGGEEMEQRLPFSTITPITLCGLKYWTKFSVKCKKAGRGHSSEELGFWSTVSLCLIFRMPVKMRVSLNLRSFMRVCFHR